MCDTGNPADVTPVEALPPSLEWKGEVLQLEPVDELSVLTVCDNTMDILLPDQGPAEAPAPGRDGPAGTDDGRSTNAGGRQGG